MHKFHFHVFINSRVGAVAFLVFLLAALIISVPGPVLAVLLGLGRPTAPAVAAVASVSALGLLVAVRVLRAGATAGITPAASVPASAALV